MSTSSSTSAWDALLADGPRRWRDLRAPWLEEDRERKLEIARLGLVLLRSGQANKPLDAPLAGFFHALAQPDRGYRLSIPGVQAWVRAWAVRDEASLRRALSCFLDSHRSPEARFEAFVKVVEQAQATGLVSDSPDDAIALGSLLNFSVAPEASPIVGPSTRLLKQMKGLAPESRAPLTDRYRSHLDIARQAEAEMKAAGVEVRDVLEVQSLISLASKRVLPGREMQTLFKHAPFVLRNPCYGPAERDSRLEIARLGRELLDTARQGEPLDPALDVLFEALARPRSYPLAMPDVERWVKGWASRDEASLRRGLECFLDHETPEARFVAWVIVRNEAHTAGFITRSQNAALAFGALLNFALTPKAVAPIFAGNQLAKMKGSTPGAGLVKRYQHHIDLAREVEAEMQAAGVGVKDMLDVHSLIGMAAVWFAEGSQDLFWPWPWGAPSISSAPPAPHAEGIPYLCLCACLGYDAPYLLEWIEFHRLVGVERFFLYNNGDREEQRALLAPYIDDGVVVLHDWPMFPPQLPALNDCIERHRQDARWIAFVDTDEFLFSPAGTPLPEILAEYEQWPAVGVNSELFGTSGHITKPDGLVIESYLRPLAALRIQRHIKSIVDPTRAVECLSGHHFNYRNDHLAVDENHHPIIGATTMFRSFSRLRVNHYHTRSEQEFLEKLSRPRPDTGEAYFKKLSAIVAKQAESMAERDADAILEYVPRLKQALDAGPRRRARA